MELERQREHMTSKCRLKISLKITFLKILTRATIAPAQWGCEEGERLPVGKRKQIFTLNETSAKLNYVNYDSVSTIDNQMVKR